MIMKKVGFVGIGKLGKDAAEVMGEKHLVDGYDINPPETTSIVMRESLVECVRGKDVVFIAVPTPHHPDYDGRHETTHLPPMDFDYSIAESVIKEVDTLVDPGTIIVMISTMLPGTVQERIAPHIKNGRFVYNPYLIAQGTVKNDMRNPEMIMIGTKDGLPSPESEFLINFYNTFVENDCRYELGTWSEVEAMKIFYNTFITTKLCLVNMIQDVAEKLGGINAEIVCNALAKSTDRIMGPKYMTPGLGDGGGCHPRDNIALRFLAEKLDLGYDLFNAIMVARERQAKNMALCLVDTIYATNGARRITGNILILGKGFKPGVNQNEGSPSILVGSYLEKFGYTVYYDDDIPDRVDGYLIGWPDHFVDYDFREDSVVLDPWRQIAKSHKYKVISYGNTR
jgi:UDPglucose 6-dehydrogenase